MFIKYYKKKFEKKIKHEEPQKTTDNEILPI